MPGDGGSGNGKRSGNQRNDAQLVVGRITGAYGIKGWVRVHSFTEPATNLFEFDRLGLTVGSAVEPESGNNASNRAVTREASREVTREVTRGATRGAARGPTPVIAPGLAAIKFVEYRPQGRGLVARIDGVDDRDAAEALRGTEIRIPEATLPALEPGDYYWRELEGLKVYTDTDDGQLLLGEVDHLLETGANDVLVLRPCNESIDERERLIPYVPNDVVTEVDVAVGVMQVRWHPED